MIAKTIAVLALAVGLLVIAATVAAGIEDDYREGQR